MSDEAHWPNDLGEVLRRLREKSGKKQADIAIALSMDQSRVSRFESGDIVPTHIEVGAFLEAVGTREAKEYRDYLNYRWVHLQRPEFGHPDVSAIATAESCLQQLDDLLSKNPSNSVRAQAQLHIEALRRAAGYLMRRDHRIAFIGEIGVGKSAAISVLFNLLVPTKDEKPSLG